MKLESQISLMLKLALEYNASVIRYASMLVNAKHIKDYRRVRDDFRKMDREYSKRLRAIYEETEVS